jgi:glycosyltransferase involved in cell wall biosynthesis
MNKGDFEVIVVDGGSKDGTLELLKSKKSENISYYVEKKRGAGAARNLGIAKSKAQFIAFTDDDCLPEQNWLSELYASFPKDKKCAAVGGIVTFQENNVFSRYLEQVRAGRSIEFGGKSLHLATTNALYRHSALLEVGSFDERMIIGEDLDLSKKIMKKGYYLKALDCAIVRHKDPKDLVAFYKKSWLHGTGIGTAAKLQGIKPDISWKKLINNIIAPKSYVSRYARIRNLGLQDRIVFAFLQRIQIIGVHNGMSHISNK